MAQEGPSIPLQLLDLCATYQQTCARIQLETPPGTLRETRLYEALEQAVARCAPADLVALRGSGTEASDAPRSAVQRLYAWALSLHVHAALWPSLAAIRAQQQTAVCVVDNEPIPFRAGFAAMAAETRRDRRAAIEAAVSDQCERLNELWTEQFHALSRVATTLGYATSAALWEDIMPVAPGGQQDMATQVLAATQEIYSDLLTWAARQRLHLPLGQIRRHDILALFTFADYHAYYQPGTVVPGIRAGLQAMSIDYRADGRLRWEEQSASWGPPKAYARHIPEEIVLRYATVGGVQGSAAFAQACGQALGWAYTSPELSQESRLLSDPALQESNAQFFAEMVAQPAWLRATLQVHADSNYALWRCLDRLYRLRRQLGRFLYTQHLYTAGSLAGAESTYRDLMMEACLVDYPSVYFLMDWDWEYTALTAFRGWGLTLALRSAIQEQCGPEWFRHAATGDWLRQYWLSAASEPLEALRDRLLGTSWDAALCAALLCDEAR